MNKNTGWRVKRLCSILPYGASCWLWIDPFVLPNAAGCACVSWNQRLIDQWWHAEAGLVRQAKWRVMKPPWVGEHGWFNGTGSAVMGSQRRPLVGSPYVASKRATVSSTDSLWCRGGIVVIVLPKHQNKILRLSLYTSKERWTKCSIHLSGISGTQRKLNRRRIKCFRHKIRCTHFSPFSTLLHHPGSL